MPFVVWFIAKSQIKWIISSLITGSHVIHVLALVASSAFVTAVLTSAAFRLCNILNLLQI